MIKRFLLNRHQKKINRLSPEVKIVLNQEIPSPSSREIVDLAELVSKVNSYEAELKARPDIFFKEKSEEFKSLIREKTAGLEKKDYVSAANAVLDEILPYYFAMIREAALRTIKLRHYDVQILGGIVLHKNKIAEMTTGEGKTLVATLAVSLNALTGKGVHVVTVNDYLARRDSEWMRPVYDFLGFSCGVIQQDMDNQQRKQAYNCDITYGTNNEFGFDYLRDNMKDRAEDMVQRGHFYAIVDEVDSILVDEARTPLIISGPAEVSVDKYYQADRVERQLKIKKVISRHDTKEGEVVLKNTDGSETRTDHAFLDENYDALFEEKSHNAYLTKRGEEKCEQALNIKSVSEDTPDPVSNSWEHYLCQSIRAHFGFHKDKEYIVKEGKVIIVDDFTGRLMPGRRWSDGLHQAVEAKENLKIQQESQTLATITLQNYFRMYGKKAGMTGTAYTEANEFRHIYDLDVVVIPTNRTLQRKSFSDRIYKNKKGKFRAVVSEIVECFQQKRPVLVGTTSIEDSEELSFLLGKQGIAHNVLNAKYHEREAHIVAQAGRLGQITIATNMAGRGTDIILGGNLDSFIKDLLEKNEITAQSPEFEQEYSRLRDKYHSAFLAEQEQVKELGGLHVIGTQRHESRRIDNQLRGRSGRQGDPGSSRFYVSLEDDLMRFFGSERIYQLMDKFGFSEDEPIESSLVTGSIEMAQKKVEGHNFEIRKQLLEYDNVMNMQREVIYSQRGEILFQENIREYIFDMIHDLVEKNVSFYLENQDREGLSGWAQAHCGVTVDEQDIPDKAQDKAAEMIERAIEAKYQAKAERLGEEPLRFMEKFIALRTIDSRWKEQLLLMDSLREGIHLRGYAQKDPLVEYQKESYFLFTQMIDSVKEEIVEAILKIEAAREKQFANVFDSLPQNFIHSEYSSLHKETSSAPVQEIRAGGEKVGRNDPCPCGSGKKYKKCCGR